MPARQSGSPRQQCIGVISAFVDSIDSHIILRMIDESKSRNAIGQCSFRYRIRLGFMEVFHNPFLDSTNMFK